MTKSVFFKPVSLAFAIVTLVESLIWGTGSFLAILCYLDIIRHDININYGLNNFFNNLYNLYLSEKPVWEKDRIVTPDVFHILMWIYFLLSLFLFFTSGVHIAVLSQKSNVRKVNVSTIIWQILTYSVCIFDAVTCILFGIDYHLLRGAIKVDSAETEVFIAVVLTLLVLSAKGFVLWIVNFVFSVIITVLFKTKITTNGEPILRTGPEADAINYSAYNAYGDVVLDDHEVQINNNFNNSIKNRRPGSKSISNPDQIDHYEESKQTSWYNTLAVESSRRSYTSGLPEPLFSPSIDPDNISTNSNWSHIPRASSFRQPRSLAASLTPSPIPPPSRSGRKSAPPDMRDRDTAYEGYSSGYRTEDDRRDDGYDEDDEDDVSQNMKKISTAYPKSKRFNLEEPMPDYDYK